MQVTVHTSVVGLTANEYDRVRWRKERTITYSKVHREREESITFRPSERGKIQRWEGNM